MLPQAAMRPWFAMIVLAGCSSAQMGPDLSGDAAPDAAPDASSDAGPDAPIDAAIDASIDGPPDIDAPTDAPIDAPTDVDAAVDAPTVDAPTDAPLDAPPCTISTGHTVALDGTGDLAAYPASQRITPGATVAASDEVAITWDPTYLYLTVQSESFSDAARPVHLYLEAATALGAATPAQGKEYGGHTAQLPFTPTHLIAVRRTNDFGSGPYDGVYVPAGAQPWATRSHALEPGTDVFISSDNRTLSVRTPWAALGGCPLALRLDLHVVHGVAANEWKDLVPSTHTPWIAPGGAHYRVALDGDPAIAGWTLP